MNASWINHLHIKIHLQLVSSFQIEMSMKENEWYNMQLLTICSVNMRFFGLFQALAFNLFLWLASIIIFFTLNFSVFASSSMFLLLFTTDGGGGDLKSITAYVHRIKTFSRCQSVILKWSPVSELLLLFHYQRLYIYDYGWLDHIKTPTKISHQKAISSW